MLDFLRGKILDAGPESVVIDVGAAGFELMTSAKTAALLPHGQECLVFTHLLVREDGILIYGFATREERSMFRLLISVTGIGPKAAAAILSSVVPQELAMCIIREDADRLTDIKGIGKKSAARIILELKDKMKKAGAHASVDETHVHMADNTADEAASALLVLGYSEKDIRRALGDIYREGMTVEEVLREALKKI